MKVLRTLLSIVFIGVLHHVLWAQAPGYWHLTDREGLPSNSIYSITEDRKGYLYLGTPGGLVRFNGFTFEVIPNRDARAADVSDLQVAPDGAIWFSNFHHELFRYTPETGIRRFAGVDKRNFNPSGSYFLDHRGNAWFNNNQRLFMLDVNTGAVTQTPVAQHYWQVMVKYGKDGFFGLTGSEAWLVEFTKYPGLKQTRIIGKSHGDKRRMLLYDAQRRMVCLTSSTYAELPDGLTVIDLDRYPWIRAINTYGTLNDGSVWVGTSSGLAILDRNGAPSWGGSLLLEGLNTSVAFRDSRGNYWFGTLNDGLYMAGNLSIRNYRYYMGMNQVNGVYSLRAIGQQLFAGTQNGEVKIFGGKEEKTLKTPLQRPVIFIAALSAGGDVLLNAYLYRAGGNSGDLLQILGSPKGYAISGGNILIGNNVGVFIFPLELLYGRQVKPVTYKVGMQVVNESGTPLRSDSLTVRNFNLLAGRSGKMYSDMSGRIWISGPDGFYYWQQGRLVKVEMTGQVAAMAADFCDDGKGGVYICLQNEGIYHWKNGVIRRLFENEPRTVIPSCRRMIFAGGRLWLATMNGIICANPATGKVFTVRINDGLLSNDIQDLAGFNGEIWVASLQGISVLPVAYEPQSRSAPVPFLTAVTVNGKNTDPNKYSVFSFDENNLTFRFDAFDYRSRDLLHYKYRLVGLSNDWVENNGARNFAVFQELPPGDYRFELLAFNDQGQSAARPMQYSFRVKRPWWTQWWFRLMAGLLLVAGVYLIIRRTLEQRRRKEKMEQDLRISQLASLKAQMNPHFMFNALNSIQDFILLNDKVNANVYLGKFSDLMRMVLDMSNRPAVTLANEIKALQLYLELEALRFEDSFTYHIEVGENLEPSEWKLPGMIIQPFVENAIKHGLLHKRGDRRLHVSFRLSEENRQLQVTIEDNGIGRAEAGRINSNRVQRHTSFATGATSRRLMLLNKDKNQIQIRYTDLMNDTGKPAGTRVELRIDLTPALTHDTEQ